MMQSAALLWAEQADFASSDKYGLRLFAFDSHILSIGLHLLNDLCSCLFETLSMTSSNYTVRCFATSFFPQRFFSVIGNSFLNS